MRHKNIQINWSIISIAMMSLFISSLRSPALAAFQQEAGVAMDMNYTFKLTEKGSPTYNHESGFKFLGGYGLGVSYKAYFQISKMELGLSAQYGWKEEAVDRSEEGSTEKTGYTYQHKRALAGIHLGFNATSFLRLNLEYAPLVHANIHWSDDKSENPFQKGDIKKGSSIGAGFSIILGDKISWSAVYRVVTYNDVKTKGTERKLPDSLYSTIEATEVTGSLAVRF